MRIILLLVGILFAFNSMCQTDPEVSDHPSKLEQELVALSEVVVKDTISERRIEANVKFKSMLIQYLTENPGLDELEGLFKTVSVISNSPKTFRIFTWQVYHNIDKYHYEGLIQTPSGQLVELNDSFEDYHNAERMTLTPDQWIGALYYNMRVFEKEKKPHFVLFGYDGNNSITNKKVCEVLHFNSKGLPVFGSAIFSDKALSRKKSRSNGSKRLKAKKRIILEYEEMSKISLNYNEDLEMIVFDHLIPIRQVDGRSIYGPDGSYQGYKAGKGVFVLVDKIYDQVSDSPPRPFPVLDNKESKSIFGTKN